VAYFTRDVNKTLKHMFYFPSLEKSRARAHHFTWRSKQRFQFGQDAISRTLHNALGNMWAQFHDDIIGMDFKVKPTRFAVSMQVVVRQVWRKCAHTRTDTTSNKHGLLLLRANYARVKRNHLPTRPAFNRSSVTYVRSLAINRAGVAHRSMLNTYASSTTVIVRFVVIVRRPEQHPQWYAIIFRCRLDFFLQMAAGVMHSSSVGERSGTFDPSLSGGRTTALAKGRFSTASLDKKAFSRASVRVIIAPFHCR
jgi:hypothetical protein